MLASWLMLSFFILPAGPQRFVKLVDWGTLTVVNNGLQPPPKANA